MQWDTQWTKKINIQCNINQKHKWAQGSVTLSKLKYTEEWMLFSPEEVLLLYSTSPDNW